MRKYVTSENKNGYSKQVQSVYNSRIKTYAKQALKDLALLAEKLPENQQTEIFNQQTLNPLIAAILKPSPEQITQLNANKELTKKKRERLRPLCHSLINQLNDHHLAHLIAPIGTKYMIAEGGRLAFLKAIYYRSLAEEEENEE